MGYGSWNAASYETASRSLQSKSQREVFHRQEAVVHQQAKNITLRESRDSEAHPCALPIIVGLDVTGSMGFVPEQVIKGSLGTFMSSCLDSFKEFSPHVCFLALGDCCARDRFPLQATQFEADNVIVEQLRDLYLEGGGGGNSFESYDLAWAFAEFKTASDAWEKRQKKGYVFTAGDEMFPQELNEGYYSRTFNTQHGMNSPQDVLDSCQERFHVFHIIVEEGSYASSRMSVVKESWKPLGKRCLFLRDHKYISELIVTAIAISEGTDREDALDMWSDSKIRRVVSYGIPQ